MPIHDWTRVDAGLFHAFHQDWVGNLARALNSNVLPPRYFALREQRAGGPIPDVLALKLAEAAEDPAGTPTGLAVATAPPRIEVVRQAGDQLYARKADRIAIRNRHGELVAIVEIVSPGNKASRNELRAFVEKAADFIRLGVHLLVIDLFPPGPRDPQGIHKAIWDDFLEEDFELPANRPLTLASYDAGPPPVAYVQPVAFGGQLIDMPLFLEPGFYVPAPLEKTYQMTWDDYFPAPMKRLLEAPAP